MKNIYLDYAATTPIHPEVIREMMPFFSENFGNPSSLYSCGRQAKEAIEKARGQVAVLIGASEDEIVFTGSGTEADNLAIKGILLANRAKGDHIITSAIEHHAVLETCKYLEELGFKTTYLPVDKDGIASIYEIKRAITSRTTLISIMQANNEIGTIQPIAEIGKIARERGIIFHTDAVQTAGHLPLDVNSLQVDLLSASAHKFYGPKGVGFLYIRKGTRLTSLLHGGEQERGRRASTENVAAIVGLGKAAELAMAEISSEAERLISLRDYFIHSLLDKFEDIRLNGHPTQRLPNNINVSIAYIEGESVVAALDKQGTCAATRSACSSDSRESSHVLQAIGLVPDLANGSLRFSLGKWTTIDDIERVLEILPGIICQLRSSSPLYRRQKQNLRAKPGEL
jgi:cysteine desulfurase